MQRISDHRVFYTIYSCIDTTIMQTLHLRQREHKRDGWEDHKKPEDQAACCKIMSSRKSWEAAPMKSYLSETYIMTTLVEPTLVQNISAQVSQMRQSQA